MEKSQEHIAYLWDQFIEDKATPMELEELITYLKSNPDDKYSMALLTKQIATHQPTDTGDKDFWTERLDQILQTVQASRLTDFRPAVSPPAIHFLKKHWFRYAAILLLLAGTGVWYLIHKNSMSEKDALTEISTKTASKSKMQLPDGTQVWINGNSQIVYNAQEFGKTNREVQLTGEAFFDVTKDAERPFIIHAGKVNITVMGTAFNVKAYPKQMQVETSLLRGLIEVTTTEEPDRKILLKPNEKIIIPVNSGVNEPSADIRPDSAGSSPYSITKLKNARDGKPLEIAWMNAQLIFDDEPFGLIAPKLESWFEIRVHFIDESLKNKRFSGVIEKESLKEVLEAMQLSSHFNYQIKGKELWVGKK